MEQLAGILPLLLIFVVFYFLLIRPQQKKLKEHKNMIANLKKGDRIVTGGMSSIFPEGIPIGSVSSFELNKAQSDYIINVKLFNDLRALRTTYVIVNKDQKEVQQLDSISESR